MSNVFDRMASINGRPSDSAVPTSASVDAVNAIEADDADGADVTSPEVKQVTQELLKHGYIEEAAKAELFRQAIIRQHEVTAALEPLDLALRLDTHRGVAVVVVAESASDLSDDSQAWKHPLVRRQRLTLQQSLLVAWLRQAFVMHEQESGVGHSHAKIAVEDLMPQFLVHFPDTGSDAKNESRLLTLLDQLKAHGIVSEVDGNQEVTIRPLIAHLATPESLSALLRVMREQANRPESDAQNEGDE